MNAIIMAAGTSSRFAPLSYEKPKGLLKVKGDHRNRYFHTVRIDVYEGTGENVANPASSAMTDCQCER